MGLFAELVLLPLAPVRVASWTVQQVLSTAEREQIGAIRDELVALEQDLRNGVISPGVFDAREDELLDRLEELEARANRR